MPKAALPVLLLTLLAGCAASSLPPQTAAQRSAPPSFAFDAALAAAPLCQAPGLSVHAGFERAALAACTIADDGHVHATIRPEAQPINPSPWYGMVIASSRDAQTMLTLHYEGGKHRYQPWFATPAMAPARLDPARITVAPDRTSATFALPPATTSLIIAQPPETIASVLAPFEARVQSGQLSRSVAGYSLDRRPITVYHHRPKAARGTIVILTRQHPPETTGPQAFAAFTDVLLGTSAAARAFRANHALMIVPLANPDGFARGHWRQNLGQKDLNRDWGPFTQPETRALARAIEAQAKAAPILAVLDFHSTMRDVIYAPPLPGGPDLAQAMLAGIDADLTRENVRIDRAHNPGNGVLKSWAKDQFGVGALTWEVGDDSPPERTKALAIAAAKALMASANAP